MFLLHSIPLYKCTIDIEIKNKQTVTRGEVGGDNWGKGGKLSRNMYKGHMHKAKGVVGVVVGGYGWGG